MYAVFGQLHGNSARQACALLLCVFLQYVSEASQQYLQSFRRYNYTTPKSYLELIALYKLLLARKRAELQAAKERLQNGVEKIAQASAQVRAFLCLKSKWPQSACIRHAREEAFM